MFIYQTQRMPVQSVNAALPSTRADLRFSNSVSALFFGIRNTTNAAEWSNYTCASPVPSVTSTNVSLNETPLLATDPVSSVKLLYDNQERLSNMPADLTKVKSESELKFWLVRLFFYLATLSNCGKLLKLLIPNRYSNMSVAELIALGMVKIQRMNLGFLPRKPEPLVPCFRQKTGFRARFFAFAKNRISRRRNPRRNPSNSSTK